MARPNRQAERRHEILDAAIVVIESRDVATLRITDVAEQIGLTPNAIRYYFKDMDELLAELAMRSDRRFFDDRRALIADTEDSPGRLSALIAAGLPTGPEDAEWRAIWRAVLAAGFELDRRSDVQGIFHRQVGLYEQVLVEGVQRGEFTLAGPATDIAMNLMALEDYYGYRIVARDPAIDRATALRMMVALAGAAVGADLPEAA